MNETSNQEINTIYSFLVLFLIFNEFSTNQALSKSFNISQVDIEEIYDINFDKSKVIDKSFFDFFFYIKILFKIYLL